MLHGLLRDLHVAAGARFPGDGDSFPTDYGDAAAEYAIARSRCAVVDRSDLGTVEVTGRDGATFLHAMLSNDVKSLAPGQGCAASLLDAHGKITTFVWLLVLEDRILVLTPPSQSTTTTETLDNYLFSEKAALRDATGEIAFFMLAGPMAAPTVEKITGAHVPDTPWAHRTARVGTADVRLVCGARETGEPEAWVVCAADRADSVWCALVDAGAGPLGRTAWESLRIEAGTPVFGHDADATVLLPEIPFEDKVSYTKGCYIGQEVVVRIRDRGHVNRMLRGLVLDGDAVPLPGASVLADGVDVGRVTSAVWSFGLRRPIALALVRRHAAEPGTGVSVRLAPDAVVPAHVSALPFSR